LDYDELFRSGIEAADLTSLLEQFEESQSKWCVWAKVFVQKFLWKPMRLLSEHIHPYCHL